MGAMDHQLGVVDEVTYGTPVVVSRFFEYESENIAETYGRTEGDPLRVGSGFVRNDRFTPYVGGAAGTIQMTVMTKGFGILLSHMLGGIGLCDPVYTVRQRAVAEFCQTAQREVSRPRIRVTERFDQSIPARFAPDRTERNRGRGTHRRGIVPQ